MTEEFKKEMQQAIKEAREVTYAKVYEENKQYLRPYLRLVLEAVKTFDFNQERFNSSLLKEKTDLVGVPSKMYTYLDKEERVGTISLDYITDGRLKESKLNKKPDYLKEETFNKEYMDSLLAEEGITVKINRADGCMSTSDTIIIKFDATELVEVLNSVKEEVKNRSRVK